MRGRRAILKNCRQGANPRGRSGPWSAHAPQSHNPRGPGAQRLGGPILQSGLVRCEDERKNSLSRNRQSGLAAKHRGRLRAARASHRHDLGIGDDGLGHFLVETLQKEGCDTSHVSVEPAPAHRRGRARDQGPRHVPADLPARELRRHGDRRRGHRRDFIRQARRCSSPAPHFSTEYINGISQRALDPAAGERRAHDPRHRLPAGGSGGSPKRGDGETRYVQSESVTAHPAEHPAGRSTSPIGTIEEFNIPAARPTSSRRSRRCAGFRGRRWW